MYWTTYKECDSRTIIQAFAAVAVDDLIYSFSGDFYSLEPIDIHVLNTNTLEYSLLPDRIDLNGERLKPPDVPIKRGDHTVVAYDKKIYLWGGERDVEESILESNILYCFDTKTLNWSRPKVSGIIPSARTGQLTCISSHIMYVFGGYDLDMGQVLRDLHCLDLKTMNWSTIITTGEIPPPTYYSDATIVNNRMYILDECKDPHKDIRFCTMYLDLELNQWHRPETTGNIPNPESCYAMFEHNNIIYVFSGHLKTESDLYSFDTKRNHWNLIKPRGKLPKRREDQSCIVIGHKMFRLDADDISASTIHVLDFNPSLKTLAIMLIIENELDFSCLPKKLRSEIDLMRQDFAHI